MNDDFRGDINTRGRYRIADAPLLISSDFSGDEDWIRVDGLKRFYGHRFFVYHAIDDPLSGVSGVNSEIYNLNGERTGISLSLNRTRAFTHLDGAASVFLASRSSPANGSQGNFRVFARYEDLVTNTGSEYLRPNVGYSRASAIETSGDIDAFRFDFQAGRTYYMSLRGIASNSTHFTTLGDPILRLFNSQGKFIKGDNNSGKGTDASLVYTSTEDQSLVLRVFGAGGSTGSYRLESRQFDDFLDTNRTAGLFFPNQAPVTARRDFPGDVDWLRYRLQKGYRYSVTGGVLIAPDGKGNVPRNFLGYQTQTAGDHFVVATENSEVQVNIVDDYTSVFDSGNGLIDPLAIGAIETVGDRDRFRASVFPFQDYKFELVANGEFTLGRSAFFNLRESHGDILASGRTQINHQIDDPTFLTQRSAYLTVGGIANGTGTYQISATLINDVAGDKTTKSSFEFANDIINIQGAIATEGDVDFHRVRLKAKTWYRFTKRGMNFLKVINPSDTNTFVGSIANPQSRDWFYALEEGDHFIEFQSGRLSDGRSTGSYTLEIASGYQPETYSNVFAWPNPAPNRFTGDPGTIDDASRQFGRVVEVYSTVDMKYQDGQIIRTIPAQELRTLSFEQWKTTVPVVDRNLGGIGELFVRSIRASGFKSRWSNVLLSLRPVPTSITTENKNQTLTYAFADGMPSYLEGNSEYASFETLTDHERSVMNTAYARWNLGIVQQNVEPGNGNDEGFAMIYKAALSTSDPVVSFQPGSGIGADIILNTNSPLVDDLSFGSEGYFELLRGIGVSLGLKETEDVGRDQSVMGLRTGGRVDSLPFASSPLALDYRATSHPDNRAVGPFATSRFYLGGDPFYDSISRSAYNFPPIDNSISAEGSTLPSIIDLRPGMTSYSKSGSEQPYTFVNAYHAPIENGIGSESNDFLFGNERRNILQGRGGNDVLIGGIATDNLLGGAGNDIYIYRPGYGDDIIDEQALGGAEVLRIEGMYNMDSLSDVSFQRLGSDLLIRLEMDGRGDRDGDSIRIKNMANVQSRVEALTLLNPSGPVTRISLVSAFNQLGTSIQTFRVTAARDSHGQIVTPI